MFGNLMPLTMLTFPSFGFKGIINISNITNVSDNVWWLVPDHWAHVPFRAHMYVNF